MLICLFRVFVLDIVVFVFACAGDLMVVYFSFDFVGLIVLSDFNLSGLK